jgi:hypothetical protein
VPFLFRPLYRARQTQEISGLGLESLRKLADDTDGNMETRVLKSMQINEDFPYRGSIQTVAGAVIIAE